MQYKDQFELMAKYNQWMNEKIYAVCASIPDADRKKDMGAFFKSIHGTLNHLLFADKAWMGRFTSQSIAVLKMGEELYADFEELRTARESLDTEIIAWTRSLESAWLDTAFEFTSKVDGETRIRPTWVLVTHMFNHQTHHRGQVTTLMMQLGYDPGVTDIPWLSGY